jgi:hypothetical protein
MTQAPLNRRLLAALAWSMRSTSLPLQLINQVRMDRVRCNRGLMTRRATQSFLRRCRFLPLATSRPLPTLQSARQSATSDDADDYPRILPRLRLLHRAVSLMVWLDAGFGGKARGEGGRGRVGSDGACVGCICVGSGAAPALSHGQSWT